MDDEIYDDEIYLDPGAPAEPPPPRPGNARSRVAALAALVLLLAGVGVVQHNRQHHSRTMPVAAPAIPLARPVQNWPQGPTRCGQTAEIPLVTSAAAAERVNDSVPVAGPKPGLVDIDSGRLVPTPGLVLAGDQYVSQAVASTAAYFSLVRTCSRRAVGTVVRSRPDAPQRIVAPDRTFYGLLSDGTGGVWGELYSGGLSVRPEGALGTTLLRLDRAAPVVVVPPDLQPLAMFGRTVVTTTTPAPVRSSIVLLDVRTRKQRKLGSSYGTSVSQATIVWNPTACPPSEACQIRTYDLRTGKTDGRSYHLPLESTLAGGVLSPDRTKFAYLLPRESSDPAYRSERAGTPSDLVVLNLRSGVIDPIPNLELAPAMQPDLLRFDRDSRWLEVGFATAAGTDIYAWHAGLIQPVRSPAR